MPTRIYRAVQNCGGRYSAVRYSGVPSACINFFILSLGGDGCSP